MNPLDTTGYGLDEVSNRNIPAPGENRTSQYRYKGLQYRHRIPRGLKPLLDTILTYFPESDNTNLQKKNKFIVPFYRS
jgi:hypothetical protein